MTPDQLRSKLINHAGLLGKIGTRMYPVAFPQNPVFPLITYSQISGQHPVDADGATGNAYVRWQFSVWSKSYSEAKQSAEQFRLAANTLLGDAIYMCEMDSELDLWDPETRLYHVPIDLVLWHSEIK